MIRLLFACSLIGLLPLRAEALEGRLIDRQTGQAVAGASVAIAGFGGTVHADRNGRFVWTPDPPAPFVVLIFLPDGRLAKPVRIAAYDRTSPILITVEAAVVDTVVVSGSAPSVDALPGSSTTLVSSVELGRRAPANVLQALENVTGVSGVAEGQSAVPAIRGLARGRTLLLLDGSRLFSERRAGPSVSFLSPDTLDRIDAVRGPASVAYGSDAFGGVISLITHQPSIGGRPGARVSATTGAGVPAERVEAEVTFGLGARAGVLIEGRRRRADDYSSPADVVPNSSWHDAGGLVRVGVNAGGWWTTSWQGDFARDSGLPRSDSATLVVSTPFERSKRATTSFDRAGAPWLGHLTMIGSFGTYAQRLDQDRLAAAGRPRRIDRADIDGTDIEIRGVMRRSAGTARLAAGADLTERRDLHAHDIGIGFDAAGAVTSTTDNASIASARSRDAGAFAQLDVPLATRLTATVGARFDRVRSTNVAGYFGNRTVSHHAASGSVSLAWRPWTPLMLVAQASRGFRDPTLSDRFFRGPVGRGFIVGNPDLEPERSVQYDVAARYTSGKWRASASYYRYDIRDLIERYQANADTFLFRNRGLARIRGVEIETGVELSPRWSFDVSAETGRGRAAEDDAALDDLAPPRIIVHVQSRVRARLSMSARIAAVGRDSDPGPSEVATPGYVDAGVSGSWTARRWIDVRVAASNLLNQRYYSSPSPRGVLAPGRYGTLTVVVKY